jgi:hypothetical protein
MSDGLKIPDSVSDRAHVVADVIELHLTWEIHNLKSSISPLAAVSSFGEFAAIFMPQIQGLADTAFFGGEDTDDLCAEITDVVLKLMRWIVEQSAMLTEHVIPEHLSSEPGLWYDEGVKTIWDLDTCMEMACQQKLQSFPEVRSLGSLTEPPGLYSTRIMNWAFTQLTWANELAGRIQRKVSMVPNHYGVKVELFGLTRQALKNYIRHGQRQIEVSRQVKEIEAAYPAKAKAAKVEAKWKEWA